ncbi:unnamed protein product [Caretta caretta]
MMEKSLCPASDPGLRTPPGNRSPMVASDSGSPPPSQQKEHSARKATKKLTPNSPPWESTKNSLSPICQTPSVLTAPRLSTSGIAGPRGSMGTVQAKDPKQAGSEKGTKGKPTIHASVPPELLSQAARQCYILWHHLLPPQCIARDPWHKPPW